MNLKLLSIVCMAVILMASCNRNDKHKPVKRRPSFLDSVFAKADISEDQLNQHLNSDNYFSGDLYFGGDTVFYPNWNYCMVVVNCGDHKTFARKYLLVFKRHVSICSSIMLIETINAHDPSTDYSQCTVNLLNENQFYTRNVTYLRDSTQKTTLKVTDKFYQLNKQGGINQLKGKPAGVDVPPYDAGPDAGDDAR